MGKKNMGGESRSMQRPFSMLLLLLLIQRDAI